MPSAPLNNIAPFDMHDQQISVLLIDDDEDLIELSADFLEHELEQADMTTVMDPTTGLTEAIEGAYDCIVCDYDMPTLNGLEVLNEIRSEGIDIPFILFTGKGSEEIASKAISAGVDEYLQKGGPEEYPVLANKIENLIEKHRAEEQVQRGFRAIESAQEGIGIIDEDGIYQYLNEAYANIYDRERTEIIGQHWEMLYPDAEADRFTNEILPELDADGSWSGYATGLTKNGETVSERLVLTPTDDGGHVCLVQRLAAEDELKQELALKNRALDAASVGVTITDPTQEDNPLVYVNDGFVTLTGYDRAEILGKNCRFLQGEDTDPETVTAIRKAIDNEEPISTAILNYDADGDPFWNYLEISPVEDEDGTVTHFVGFQRDVTELKAEQSAMEDQVEWLSEFAEVVSHDLKNPLSVIRGNIELAKQSGEMDRLTEAQQAADRLDELIDDLSNVMRQRQLVNDLEPVDFAEVFQSVGWSEGGSHSVDIADSNAIVADKQALARLVENLVRNTIEHGGEGTTMRVGTLPDGFYYEDTGPGLPGESPDTIFKPGFTTKDDGPGLGMVSIRQIAAGHGWEISLAESPEGGARFEFTNVDRSA
ncbi:PAS domain-containing protein [Haloarcula sp. JP-L23]|uniref:PAS domain-containing protein n=1 Tax=Haloarcula sp. JP-L23 TaxID=2716717 RepID=UPI00140EF360|nr:PAS domain-containing protein [Haloarcula sp. JP-L23]